MGVEHIALGSDFDGATMPAPLGDCAGLPKLMDVLVERGWDDNSLRALAHGNWMRGPAERPGADRQVTAWNPAG